MDYTDAERLSVIMRTMNSKTFGFRFSEKIVGGRARLERLIIEGKVRAEKETSRRRTVNGCAMLRTYCLTQNANRYGTVERVDDGTGNLCRWLRYAGTFCDTERIRHWRWNWLRGSIPHHRPTSLLFDSCYVIVI